MIELPDVIAFDWDHGNRSKNAKHGVSWPECEEVFFNRPLLRVDGGHSEIEQRFQERGHQAVSPNLHQPQMECRITRKAFLTRYVRIVYCGRHRFQFR
jgi:uncharacterized DUF497 family protein